MPCDVHQHFEPKIFAEPWFCKGSKKAQVHLHVRLYIYVCMFAWMYVCMHVCLLVFVDVDGLHGN